MLQYCAQGYLVMCIISSCGITSQGNTKKPETLDLNKHQTCIWPITNVYNCLTNWYKKAILAILMRTKLYKAPIMDLCFPIATIIRKQAPLTDRGIYNTDVRSTHKEKVTIDISIFCCYFYVVVVTDGRISTIHGNADPNF